MVTDKILHLELLKLISGDYGVTVYFFADDKLNAGLYDGHNIFLNAWLFLESEDILYSTFFHELTHFMQHRKGSYNWLYSNIEKAKTRKAAISKMESATDRQAEKLMHIYFPELKFNFTY